MDKKKQTTTKQNQKKKLHTAKTQNLKASSVICWSKLR